MFMFQTLGKQKYLSDNTNLNLALKLSYNLEDIFHILEGYLSGF
jgi:hypothetical protein